jgi:hypothetical protein
MRAFSEGNLEGRDGRCPAACESEVTCAGPGAGEAPTTAPAKARRSVDLVMAGAVYRALLPFPATQTCRLGRRQAAAQGDDA